MSTEADYADEDTRNDRNSVIFSAHKLLNNDHKDGLEWKNECGI